MGRKYRDDEDEYEDGEDSGHENEEDEEDDEEDDEPDFDENLVFVIMAFNEGMKETYEAIKGACSRIGLRATIVNESVGGISIVDRITDLIDRAEFIVCDLTAERPNVYYELGYAHGSGNEPERILLIAKEGTKLHFDIASLRVEFYSSTEHLRSIVQDRLKRMRKLTRSEEWLNS